MVKLILRLGLLWLLAIKGHALTILTQVKTQYLAHHPHSYVIILTFDHPVAAKTFTLKNPDRWVLDFADTRAKKKIAACDWRHTPVISLHTGIQQGVNLRLVFNLAPEVTHSYTTAIYRKKFEVILMLTAPTRALQPIKSPIAAIDASEDGIAQLINTHLAQSVDRGSAHQPFVVVIDAGHGGKDPGTISQTGIQEKQITLAIAKDLAALVHEAGMRAVLTRRGDDYVGLRARLMLARKARGDTFVAIHADAYSDTEANGAAIFALSPHGASSESALWLAKQENYSELGNLDLNITAHQDSQLRSILINLSQTAATTASLQLGDDILKQLQSITNLHYHTVQQAPFMVLKSPDIPSILIETGFLSNPAEATRLDTKDYQQQLAAAIFAGIRAYEVHYADRNMRLVKI